MVWIFDPLDVLDWLTGILLSIATSQVRSKILPIFRCFRQTSQPTLSFKKTANILSSEPGKLLLSQLFEAPQWTSDRSRWRTPARLSVAIQTSNYHILQQIQTSQSDLSHLHDHWKPSWPWTIPQVLRTNDYRNRRSITISQFLQGAWISFFSSPRNW